MKLLEWKPLELNFQEARNKERLSKIFLFFLILGGIYLVTATFYSEFRLLFLDDGSTSFFLKESSGRILLVSFLPFWFYFLIATFQFLLNFSFKLSMRLTMKSGILSCFFMVLGVIPFNYFVESTLEDKGYFFCNWYTAPSVIAPDVWLKNDELCLQDGSVITSDIYDWFEMHNQKGIEPTLNELEVFIQETRAEYNR
ncbi:DUF1240 domain-containing protein [Pseudoalteromonas sp. SK18]|uniref:DUF1240 domain-containing protein n=1 Tax=Pseudoalteromonas sp. SK18 TaxID=1938366 RepID=UPI0009770694|nr:DUF1240 domain-containing protein [Pseudoalteromonas sp. SK18]